MGQAKLPRNVVETEEKKITRGENTNFVAITIILLLFFYHYCLTIAPKPSNTPESSYDTTFGIIVPDTSFSRDNIIIPNEYRRRVQISHLALLFIIILRPRVKLLR